MTKKEYIEFEAFLDGRNLSKDKIFKVLAECDHSLKGKKEDCLDELECLWAEISSRFDAQFNTGRLPENICVQARKLYRC